MSGQNLGAERRSRRSASINPLILKPKFSTYFHQNYLRRLAAYFSRGGPRGRLVRLLSGRLAGHTHEIWASRTPRPAAFRNLVISPAVAGLALRD